MKKFFLILTLILFSANYVFAQGFDWNSVKNFTKKPLQTEKIIAAEQSADNELTKSEQANLLYNENNLKNVFEL